MTVIGTKPRCTYLRGKTGTRISILPFATRTLVYDTPVTMISIATGSIFYYFIRYSISSAGLFIKYERLATRFVKNNASQYFLRISSESGNCVRNLDLYIVRIPPYTNFLWIKKSFGASFEKIAFVWLRFRILILGNSSARLAIFFFIKISRIYNDESSENFITIFR